MPPLIDRRTQEDSSIECDSDSDDDQSIQTTELMQQLFDRIIQGDYSTDNESTSDSDSRSDESPSDSQHSTEHNYDPNNSGAQFRHMIMTPNSTRHLDPFQNSNENMRIKLFQFTQL